MFLWFKDAKEVIAECLQATQTQAAHPKPKGQLVSTVAQFPKYNSDSSIVDSFVGNFRSERKLKYFVETVNWRGLKSLVQQAGKHPKPEKQFLEITAKNTEVGIYERIGEALEQYRECTILGTELKRAIHGLDKSVGVIMASRESVEGFVFRRAELDEESLSDAACCQRWSELFPVIVSV